MRPCAARGAGGGAEERGRTRGQLTRILNPSPSCYSGKALTEDPRRTVPVLFRTTILNWHLLEAHITSMVLGELLNRMENSPRSNAVLDEIAIRCMS
ncbi:hypothetical protein PVAP13_3KG108027 [Panicum virgatum]|uniref:Uncharacterized protein n=1 Tax=Panicum virgatum TaxID=38727 RepID=A0A8T0UNH5_PANVG|nr:hypothetical protein PVAP13_3KG108027 [Panicum virgatum]